MSVTGDRNSVGELMGRRRVEVIRDRVVDVRRMKARELLDNDGNWRTHPGLQRDTLLGVLRGIGQVGALLVYPSARNHGALTLIDGHLRKDIDPELEWTVLVTDLNDEEADLMLALYDPLSAMAGRDHQKLGSLLERVRTDDLAVREVLRKMQLEVDHEVEEDQPEPEQDEGGPAEMELQPFEHYDYIVLFFRTSFDFERALDLLGVKKERFTARTLKHYDGAKAKVGVGRAVDGAQALERVCQSGNLPKPSGS